MEKKHSYDYFANRECPYFPCHEKASPAQFNCLFCYCPLYRAPKCGGAYVMRNGRKDCSYCLLPHNDESYAYISAKLREEGLFPEEK